MTYITKYQVTEEGRECSRCRVFKSWDEFAKNKSHSYGYQCWCRDCFREHEGREKKKEYIITDEGRECSKCGEFKPWDEYHVRRDLSTGHASHCKACCKKRTRCNMDNGSTRDRELRKKYGIGLAEYYALVEIQGDACAICGTKEKGRARGRIRYWSVDHDHGTGAIRALLCAKCNTLLGLAGDDPLVLQRAIDYLKEHGKVHST